MNKPESIMRTLVEMSAYEDHVIAKFRFGTDFRSSEQSLSATLSVHADKTASIRDIERMADKDFLEMLRAILALDPDAISD